ncbi:MAG: (Fe-S)-binding protein [Candidatus Helarchaeota archaeon]
MDPNSLDIEDQKIDYKNYKNIKDRFICPTKEVNPNHFIEPDIVSFMHLFPKLFKPNEKRFIEIYNCVHCNACKMGIARYYLKSKLNKAGFISNDTKIMANSFKKYGNPFNRDKFRFKIPNEVSEDSDTLFYLGCLSYAKVPNFTLNAIKYLLRNNIDFTILKKEFCCGIPAFEAGDTNTLNELINKNTEILNSYKKVICLCPACFDIFSNFYKNLNTEIYHISDYLKPSKIKKSGRLSIQHLCQLENRNKPTMHKINNILKESGYKIQEDEKHWCCGGGMGLVHIQKTIEKIARIRIHDFKGEIITTYCPSCYHVLKLFLRKEYGANSGPKLIDTFSLLLD